MKIQSALRGILCSIVLMSSWDVLALCSSSQPVINIEFPTVMDIQGDAPVGTVIAKSRVAHTVTCRPPVLELGQYTMSIYLSEDNTVSGGPVEGLYAVVPTGTPGIGLRWINTTSQAGPKAMTNTRLNDTSTRRGIRHPSEDDASIDVHTFEEEFELVKTGKLAMGGNLFTIPPISLKQEGGNNFRPDEPVYTIAFPSSMVVTSASCSLVKDVIKVDMKEVASSDFSGAGSTSEEIPFSIDFDCISGARINLEFDSTLQVQQFPGTISLSNDSTAEGVGIRITNQESGLPVTFGKPMFLREAIEGRQSLDFSASYLQTDRHITPGAANGALTFIATYL
ncbi:fimbrial protein [Pseudomonas sp. BN414]|uniref:fimbrial protein n=1 Tax=Pseudomonas sp. BN414 TaxID=2567888 RepID=UPI002458FF45|nr:fimbrial protein [Pseudomonas sp. BN414]